MSERAGAPMGAGADMAGEAVGAVEAGTDERAAGAAEAEQLLGAGAVLPPGTPGAGPRAVPLTTRAYRHPGLDDRVVVRLVAGELGAAEDMAAGFLGLEPDGEPVEVGLGLRQSLSFPEWVLVHHPRDGRQALGLVPELERVARQAKTKPKAALTSYQQIAGRLADSVPHFLPTFLEQAGRVFLGAENPTYAGQMFMRAREADKQHGLAVDEERLDAVFLEFALAGALPVKALSGYARELAARLPADEAYRRFRELCVRRTAGGIQPSVQMSADLRKLAKATGSDMAVAEGEYLTDLLALPATRRAAPGWWKAHRPALAALSRREPSTRGRLLDVLPEDHDCVEFWLELLEECGATAGLWDSGLPAGQRPSDGTVGWYLRFMEFRSPSHRVSTRLPEFYPLVERMAGRLREELAAPGSTGALPVPYGDVDLLDLLLSLGVPVADPKTEGWIPPLHVREWARPKADHRDLRALEADARFRPAFLAGLDHFGDEPERFRVVAESPGGRPMVTEWMNAVARRAAPSTLPLMPEGLNRLGRLPGLALALAEDEVRAVAATDLAPLLVRTLRAGIFDELGWPAWEAAVAELMPEDERSRLVVADAWPHLIVGGTSQARVLDAEGAVLTHDLRIPENDMWWHHHAGFHYVDGQLLVHWWSASDGGGLQGYWHTAADRPFPVESAIGVRGVQVERLGSGLGPYTVPRPGGGRLTGGGVLHAGDTALPEERSVITDGTRFWTRVKDAEGVVHLRELDPRTGETGDVGGPDFFAEAKRDAPEGSELAGGTLLPAPSDVTGPGSHPVGGLLGRRVVNLPDGSVRCEDVAGNAVTLAPGVGRPSRPLMFPGDDRPRGVSASGSEIRLVDPEGGITALARVDGAPGSFAEGTAVLPPESYWHCLGIRDPRGSEALRAVDGDTAATLLAAAVARAERARKAQREGKEWKEADHPDELPSLIAQLLPEVTHDALVRGIAGVVRFAAEQQAALDAIVERLDSRAVVPRPKRKTVGPKNELIGEALNGLADDCQFSRGYSSPSRSCVGQLQALGELLAGPAEADVTEEAGVGAAVRLHLDGSPLPSDDTEWDELLGSTPALAFRAASVTTAPEHRAALGELLAELDTIGMTTAEGTDRWRVCQLRLADAVFTSPDGTARSGHWSGALRLPGGAFLAVIRSGHWAPAGRDFTALFHDPAGRFEIPAPYTRRSAPREIGVGEGRAADWFTGFRAELAARGPAPWFPAAAEEFARLTGVTRSMAALVVAGLPQVTTHVQGFLPTDVRNTLGLKAPNAALARDTLRRVDVGVRRAVVAALLPADPARLWTDGPDVAGAAEVWNSALGRRTPVSEEMLLVVAEAVRAVRSSWTADRTLRALLDPSGEPQLAADGSWRVKDDRVVPVGADTAVFDTNALTTLVATAAWLAHGLPAGHPIRALLPGMLSAVRERLANPELTLGLGRYVHLSAFRKAAGAPTETGEGYERYGAVITPTSDDRPMPAVRVALLDEAGGDPYLPVLRGIGDGYGYGPGRTDAQVLFPAEAGLRVARDPRFAALVGDPGDPAAGGRDKDGTWYPQDPSRSVPDLVGEAAKEYGIGEDAAVLYLMLLAMPDPTDTNVARWTGWKRRRGGAARIEAAREELAATDLVVRATRTGARRSLFLPGGWTDTDSGALPLERWKLPLFDLVSAESAPLDVIVPTEPVADLYRRAWRRIREGDIPRFDELRTRRVGRGGRG
ncbi:DNA-binding protein [Streptomyces sp. NPDC058653]|uniref:DNA-binding protein n=1 Tax=Streptomyces sp. NPDC058653 TaxID=3346576 RepID=UPI00365C1935